MDFYRRNNINPCKLVNVSSPSQLLDNRSREDLLRCAFWQIRDLRKWRGRTVQHFIAAMTAHGSGYSWQICQELGWDPDMKITPKAELPRAAQRT